MDVFGKGWRPKVGDTVVLKTADLGDTLHVVTRVGETIETEQVGSALPALWLTDPMDPGANPPIAPG